MKSLLRSLRLPLTLGFLLLASLAAAAESKPVRVLFLGNSYLFGSGSSSRFFRPNTVTDLNQAKIGGVPALFKSFPQNPPPPVKESEPWRRDMGNWGRVFYRTLALFEKDPRAGRCWARIEYRVEDTEAEHAKFQAATAAHLQNLLAALPGVHRIWQLRHAPHAGQIAGDPVGNHMNLFEIDAPENLFDPSLGAERMPLHAGQQNVGRHFTRLLQKADPQR